jgi:hypothetical protein
MLESLQISPKHTDSQVFELATADVAGAATPRLGLRCLNYTGLSGLVETPAVLKPLSHLHVYETEG